MENPSQQNDITKSLNNFLEDGGAGFITDLDAVLLITPSAKQTGFFQLTRFFYFGPPEDTQFEKLEDAIKSAINDEHGKPAPLSMLEAEINTRSKVQAQKIRTPALLQ